MGNPMTRRRVVVKCAGRPTDHKRGYLEPFEIEFVIVSRFHNQAHDRAKEAFRRLFPDYVVDRVSSVPEALILGRR